MATEAKLIEALETLRDFWESPESYCYFDPVEYINDVLQEG